MHVALTRRREVVLALLGAAAAFATDRGYVALLSQQPPAPDGARTVFIQIYIYAIAAAALAAVALLTASRNGTAHLVLVGAATAAFALGLLAIFSIGVALLLTGLLLILSAGAVGPGADVRRGRWRDLGAGAVGVAVLAVGIAVTGGL